jgi:hypothetical protein
MRTKRSQSVSPAAALAMASLRRLLGGHIVHAAANRNSGDNDATIEDQVAGIVDFQFERCNASRSDQ